MSALVQEFLQNWEAELLQLRPNDPLIDLTQVPKAPTESALWLAAKEKQQLYKDFKKIERERGVNALVQYEGLLKWERQQKEIQTPIFLRECLHINWANESVTFEENLIVNPFLTLYLKSTLDIELSESNTKICIEQLLATGLFSEYLPDIGFANLHPQRYELRKEWEGLKAATVYSSALHQLLGDVDAISKTDSIEFEPLELSALDPDQRAAVNKSMADSLVIYGPPGTGKSVVLTNVIGQALAQQQQILVVSDKIVALEVIEDKLSKLHLKQCCVHLDSNLTVANFYKQLKSRFAYLLQAATAAPIDIKTKFIAADFWQQQKELESLTGKAFTELFAEFEIDDKTKGQPTSNWKIWLAHKEEIRGLNSELLSLLPLLQKYWQEETAQAIFEVWGNWCNLYQKVAEVQSFTSWQELRSIVEKSLRCVQFQTNVYQNYTPLLDQNPEQQLKRLLKFQALQVTQKRLKDGLKVWIQLPTQPEWEQIKQLGTSKKWLTQLKWRRLEKKWLRTPGLDLRLLEKSLEKHWRLQTQIGTIQEHFTSMGVMELTTHSATLIALLKQHKPEEWAWYRSLSTEQIQSFCQLHQSAYQLQQLHGQLFTELAEDFSILQQQISAQIAALLEAQKKWQRIPYELWAFCANLKYLEQEMKHSFWADLRFHYPALYQVNVKDLEKNIDKDLKTEEKIWKQHAQQLLQQQIEQFKALQGLLDAPLQKLSVQQKELRQVLRKGKAILVKELAKSRQQMRIEDLLESPAAPWLRVIFPVWLCTPTTLAKHVPLSANFFDIGLFDEASQLPLSHAIGALQRVSKVIVAGDPQQMRPKSYFSKSVEGVVDLLHQAAFYLPSSHLKHHYRSEDPSLIAFSNLHFYDNTLKVWPSKPNPKNGLFDRYVPAGVYTKQQNIQEAKVLAKQLSDLLDQTEKIGVVAFSQTQLACIYQQLMPAKQAQLETRIAERSAFFLALEQVQGEECDILLISFGYGKNEAGLFSLKIGPMNQAQSTRRLNVLLTRAQKALHFYSSVRASDFPKQRSAATNKLWEWFVFLEKNQIQQVSYDAQERLAAAADYPTYLTYYRVLKQREVLYPLFAEQDHSQSLHADDN